MGVRAISLVPNGVGPNSASKSPFIKCINHYSLINFHFSSDTDGVKCVHGSALPRREILPHYRFMRFVAHWPEYVIEGSCLGLFMISACGFGTLLGHPDSPVVRFVGDPTL